MRSIATPKGTVEIREFARPEELADVEDLQQQVWGADTHPQPKESIIATQHVGGLAAGAFGEDGRLVGMIFGFPTRDPLLMHSHLLATLPAWRGCGIGAQLKWFQRDWCLAHGYTGVQWTVDPLRAANAELNFRRLGVEASTYYLDYYGPMNGIDAGAPTDRLLVTWDLASERVAARAVEAPVDTGFALAQAANTVVDGECAACRLDLAGQQVLLRIPEDYIALAGTDRDAASCWRMQTREIFQAYLQRGYRIREFTRVGGSAYLLVHEEGE
jgi:chorismate synthase